MEAWYKFTAYNSQAQYGYGTEAQAERYVDLLNKDRDINVYAYKQITDAEEIANLDKGDAGFSLDDVEYGE